MCACYSRRIVHVECILCSLLALFAMARNAAARSASPAPSLSSTRSALSAAAAGVMIDSTDIAAFTDQVLAWWRTHTAALPAWCEYHSSPRQGGVGPPGAVTMTPHLGTAAVAVRPHPLGRDLHIPRRLSKIYNPRGPGKRPPRTCH